MPRATRITTLSRTAKILALCKKRMPVQDIAAELKVSVITVRKYINEGALHGHDDLEKMYVTNPTPKKKKVINRQLLQKLGAQHGVRV